jgi:hypothetical protein
MIPANNRHSSKTLSIASRKVPAAARAVAPKSETENQAMFAAEQEAKDRAEKGVPAPTGANSSIDRRAKRRAGRNGAGKRQAFGGPM